AVRATACMAMVLWLGWVACLVRRVYQKRQPGSTRRRSVQFAPPRRGDVDKPLDRPLQQRPRDTAHAIALRVVGEVLDRRLAVDARQEEARQQRRGAPLEFVARFPGGAAEVRVGQRLERG